MITRIVTAERERIYDGEIGRFVEASAIPCHRCGICCERWQPLVSPDEAARLAGHLGMDAEAFTAAYTEPYPFDDTVRLLRREEHGCVFLGQEDDGRAACAVHPARPDACRNWIASLDRSECVDGLAYFGAAGAVLPVSQLYPDDADRAAFTRVARGHGEAGDDG